MLLAFKVLLEHRARARPSVLASVVQCTPPAPLLYRADVPPWVGAPAWARALVVRRVRVVCWVLLLVHRLLESLPVLAPV